MNCNPPPVDNDRITMPFSPALVRSAAGGRRLHGGERRSRSGKGVRPANSRGGRCPRAQTHAGRPGGTPLSPGSSVTVPLNIRRHPPSADFSYPGQTFCTFPREMELTVTQYDAENQLPGLG